MVSSNSRPAEVIWNYDRVELIADGIVHAIGVSLEIRLRAAQHVSLAGFASPFRLGRFL